MGEPILDKPIKPDHGGQLPDDGAKELIGNLVTVFRIIPRETLQNVRAQGIAAGNSMDKFNPELEQIFNDEASKHGIKTERSKCVFAFPSDPRTIEGGLSYDPKEDMIIKMQIDPGGAIVTDGSTYTDASITYYNGWIESAQNYANQYYEEAIPLQKYLRDRNREDFVDFSFPEIQIPSDIPPYRIEVLK